MAERLYMIALSPTMSEGTIARWQVAEGEAYKAGQVLCEVETDKASMDYEAPKDAVLLKVVLPQGGRAAVGEMIAVVGAQGEDIGALLSVPPSKTAPAPSPAPAPAPAPAAAPTQGISPAGLGAVAAGAAAVAAMPPPLPAPAMSPGPRATGPGLPAGLPPSSPLARDRAHKLGLDLRGLAGTGPGGRIVLRDVEHALAGGGAGGGAGPGSRARGGLTAAPEDRRIAVTGKRAVIARRLSESFFSAPHFYLTRRVAMERVLDLRSSLNAGRERPLSLNAFIVKLCAAAIGRHRYVNSTWEGESILERGSIDVALAVALPDGLVTPVVRDCGSKGVEEIDGEFAALIEKARSRGLASNEYEGASFTISNLGSYGVEEFTAIINPPGSAILAVGAARLEAVVLPDGGIGSRRLAALTLGCDHRVIDGAAGAAFLGTLVDYFEEPGKTLI